MVKCEPLRIDEIYLVNYFSQMELRDFARFYQLHKVWADGNLALGGGGGGGGAMLRVPESCSLRPSGLGFDAWVLG